jgi:hypothetical protein
MLTKSVHADRLPARLSGDGFPDVLTAKDVDNQLSITTFSSCIRCPPAELF